MGNQCSGAKESNSARSSSSSVSVTAATKRSAGVSVDDLYEQAIPEEHDAPHDYLCKILLLGDSGVGKSCIMARYADNSFQETFISTIGMDFKMKTVTIDGKVVKIQLWDTAGQERFRAITRSYYKGIHCYIVVYDITNKASFEHVDDFLNGIAENAVHGTDCLLLGNKSDLSHIRCIEPAEGQARADAASLDFMETSAKTSSNVNSAIDGLVGQFVSHMNQYMKRRKA